MPTIISNIGLGADVSTSEIQDGAVTIAKLSAEAQTFMLALGLLMG